MQDRLCLSWLRTILHVESLAYSDFSNLRGVQEFKTLGPTNLTRFIGALGYLLIKL